MSHPLHFYIVQASSFFVAQSSGLPTTTSSSQPFLFSHIPRRLGHPFPYAGGQWVRVKVSPFFFWFGAAAIATLPLSKYLTLAGYRDGRWSFCVYSGVSSEPPNDEGCVGIIYSKTDFSFGLQQQSEVLNTQFRLTNLKLDDATTTHSRRKNRSPFGQMSNNNLLYDTILVH